MSKLSKVLFLSLISLVVLGETSVSAVNWGWLCCGNRCKRVRENIVPICSTLLTAGTGAGIYSYQRLSEGREPYADMRGHEIVTQVILQGALPLALGACTKTRAFKQCTGTRTSETAPLLPS